MRLLNEQLLSTPINEVEKSSSINILVQFIWSAKVSNTNFSVAILNYFKVAYAKLSMLN